MQLPSPNEKKVQYILNYPEPRNKKELSPFLGLAGSYRKFVRAIADMAHPLTSRTRKDAEWKWGDEQKDAFNRIKCCLTSKPILRYPDFTRDFIVHMDASISTKWQTALSFAKEQLIKAQTKQRGYYDTNSKVVEYSDGDYVLLRSPPVPCKFQYRWLEPYVVVQRISSLTYEINLPGASENVIVHVNRLKKSPRIADSELPSERRTNEEEKERTPTETRRTPEKGENGPRVTKANDDNSCRSGRSFP